MAALNVKVKADHWCYPSPVPETSVTIEDGSVTWEGEHIGFVWKGSRTYSPPTHKGSRIVRYHKRVPEWHAHPTSGSGLPRHRADTRQDVLRLLISEKIAIRAIEGKGAAQ